MTLGHGAADAVARDAVMRRWAALCDGADDDWSAAWAAARASLAAPAPAPRLSRRRLLDCGWRAPSSRFGPEGPPRPRGALAGRGAPPAVRRVFLADGDVAALVAACGPGARRHDAVAAWCWRTVARACDADGAGFFGLHTVCDLRRRTGRATAAAAGNATATVCAAATAGDVRAASLASLAAAARASVARLDGARGEAALFALASVAGGARGLAGWLGDVETRFDGANGVLVSDMTGLCGAGLDLGAGAPRRVCGVVPRTPGVVWLLAGAGGVDAWVCADERALARLAAEPRPGDARGAALAARGRVGAAAPRAGAGGGPVDLRAAPAVYVNLDRRPDRRAAARAGQGCELPHFKGSDLGRFPLVLADFWTRTISRNGLDAWTRVPERARAERSR